MNGIVRIRLLKTILILVAAAAAVFVYFNRSSHKTADVNASNARVSASAQPIDPKNSAEHQIKMLTKALSENPGHAPVLLQLAKLEYEQGRYPDAAHHLKEILDREPDNPDARLELGKALYQQGDIRGALDQTQQILKKHPSNPDALYNLGAMYGNIGNKERAGEYWRRLIATDPNSDSGRLAQQMLPRLENKDR